MTAPPTIPAPPRRADVVAWTADVDGTVTTPGPVAPTANLPVVRPNRLPAVIPHPDPPAGDDPGWELTAGRVCVALSVLCLLSGLTVLFGWPTACILTGAALAASGAFLAARGAHW